MRTKQAVIIANGAFPQRAGLIEVLKQADFLICCDGAIQNLDDYQIYPNLIIGDLDSIPSALRKKYEQVLHFNPDQYTNDLTKAVCFAQEQGFSSIKILGATGKRDDHTLGNLSLLLLYAQNTDVELLTDYGKWIAVFKDAVFDSFKGQQVSVFSANPETEIYSENLRYPLSGMKLKYLWTGTLNESCGDQFSLRFDKGELIVFRSFKES